MTVKLADRAPIRVLGNTLGLLPNIRPRIFLDRPSGVTADRPPGMVPDRPQSLSTERPPGMVPDKFSV